MMKVENSTERKKDVSIILSISLAILGKLIIPNDECMACTVGVASGYVTTDGRPLAWKARAPDHTTYPVRLVHVSAYPYDYLDVRNDFDKIGTPMGLSESGMTGGNATLGAGGFYSQGYILQNFDDVDEVVACYNALSTGELSIPGGTPYEEESAFIHIDPNGRASVVECNTTNWIYEYDTMDPDREAQGLLGFVVRANEYHARPDGTDDTSITGGRYESGTYNVKGLVDINMLSARTLVQGNDGSNGYEFARYGPGRELHTLGTYGTNCFMVVHGVAPGEDPALSTMWVILGPPNYGFAVPVWAKVKDIPDCLKDGSTYYRVRSLRQKGNEIATQASIFPAEAHLFDMVENIFLPHWRDKGVPSEAEMTRIEHQVANDAYSLLNCLDYVQNNNMAPEVSVDVNSHETRLKFTAAANDVDGTIAAIEWDFGDGHSSTEISPVHMYADPGTYLISCTVTDDDGVSITGWKYFDVIDYDLADDNVINFLDLVEFTNHWLDTNCVEPNWCQGTDFNRDETVNAHDYSLFSQYWLQTFGLPDSIARPKFVFAPNSPDLIFARDSIAYDHSFNEFDIDAKRIENVCLASRADITVNREEQIKVYDVDGNEALCGFIDILYTTMDGEDFIPIVDINSATPLDSGGYFSDYTVPEDIIEGLRVMADGSWLLSVGRLQVDMRGHLFRSTNKGASWSVCKFAADGSDFQFGMGYMPPWHSIGIAGPEVVVGEYGDLHQPNNPRRIYYSDDYGATWTMIIDIGPAGWEPSWTGQRGQHCHAVCFGIQDTNTVYASWGDADFMRVSKFVCSGDKKNPSNWQEAVLPWGLFTYQTNPVCFFNDGSHIYVGRDAGNCPALWRFDSQENYESVLSWPTIYSGVKEVPYRYPYNDDSYVFGIIKHNGIYYAGASSMGWIRKMGGIYVSTDGKHWVCAYRVEGEKGPYTTVGYANGYIWGTFWDSDAKYRLFKFPPVKAELVSALRVERGITNIANSANNSYFDTAVEGWSGGGNTDSVVWTDTERLLGGGCIKVTTKNGAGTQGYVYSKSLRDMGGLPSPGDMICVSCWVKAAESWHPGTVFCINFHNTTNIATPSSQIPLTEEWQRIVVWAKCNGTPSNALKIKFNVYAEDYLEDFSDLQWYIDGFQVVYFPDLYYSGDWQKGGDPRADELAIWPLTGLSNSFTLSFTWLPDSGSREWLDDCPIASIVGADSSYLELFWDYSQRRYAITDGTNTETIASNSTWEHLDMVKFAIVCDGRQTSFYVENSASGLTSVTGSNGCTLTGAPSHMVLSSDNHQGRLGTGLFSTVKVWDWEFTPTDVNQVFDIID